MSYFTNIINELQDEFEGISISFQEINYSGKLPCFFISIESEEKLADIWMKVSDLVAVNFQSQLESEFSVWNIYIFFIVEQPVSNKTKYLIENDTFSSRKIVIEGKNTVKEVIDKYILNKDIKISSSVSNQAPFIPDAELYDEISEIAVKSRVTNSIKDAHSLIVKKLKAEDYEV